VLETYNKHVSMERTLADKSPAKVIVQANMKYDHVFPWCCQSVIPGAIVCNACFLHANASQATEKGEAVVDEGDGTGDGTGAQAGDGSSAGSRGNNKLTMGSFLELVGFGLGAAVPSHVEFDNERKVLKLDFESNNMTSGRPGDGKTPSTQPYRWYNMLSTRIVSALCGSRHLHLPISAFSLGRV
jgi:hypothetical protein